MLFFWKCSAWKLQLYSCSAKTDAGYAERENTCLPSRVAPLTLLPQISTCQVVKRLPSLETAAHTISACPVSHGGNFPMSMWDISLHPKHAEKSTFSQNDIQQHPSWLQLHNLETAEACLRETPFKLQKKEFYRIN